MKSSQFVLVPVESLLLLDLQLLQKQRWSFMDILLPHSLTGQQCPEWTNFTYDKSCNNFKCAYSKPPRHKIILLYFSSIRERKKEWEPKGLKEEVSSLSHWELWLICLKTLRKQRLQSHSFMTAQKSAVLTTLQTCLAAQLDWLQFIKQGRLCWWICLLSCMSAFVQTCLPHVILTHSDMYQPDATI